LRQANELSWEGIGSLDVEISSVACRGVKGALPRRNFVPPIFDFVLNMRGVARATSVGKERCSEKFAVTSVSDRVVHAGFPGGCVSNAPVAGDRGPRLEQRRIP